MNDTRASQSRLQELLDALPGGVTVYEPVGRASDFIIRYMNRASERIDGLRRERYIGRRLSRVFPEAGKMGLLAVLRRVRRTGRPEKLPTAYYAGGKNPGWRENHVFKLSSGEVASSYSDVSEYVRVSELFRKVFHLSPSAMSLSSLPDGRVIDANEEFLRLVGYRREEVLGRRTRELGMWQDPGQRAEVQARILREGRVRNVGLSLRSRSGESVSALWSGDIVEMEGKSCLLGAALDLTELKKSEQALIQAQRLVSVGTLAAGVAHEINNPLAALSGELQWLKRKSRGARVQRSLAFMLRVSRRIADTVSHLLAFSRSGPSDARRPSAVNTLVERSLALVGHRLDGRNIRLRKSLGRGLPSVQVNRSQMEQVLTNLLANSLDAMPGRGRLSISTRLDASRGRVEIAVEDTGCGIAPKDLGKVFDPFFTTKPPGKGVGLGLSVSHGIVTGHGGRIRVTSEKGKGTKVVVELPAEGDGGRMPGSARRRARSGYRIIGAEGP